MSAAGVAPDWRTLNLADGGRSLIEASAGTGKTWTIAVLYLRLLLERGLAPTQIVVTTFTDAAAQELRERLRGRLDWGLLRATTDAGAGDPAADDEAWLRARWTDAAQRGADIACLHQALAALDVAPIGTLHGLCRRVLAEHPFACGVAFSPGELVAGELLLDEVVADLWRRLQQGDDDDELRILQQAAGIDLSLPTLRKNLRLCLSPDVAIDVLDEGAIKGMLPRAWAPRLRALVADDALFTRDSPLRRYWAALADALEDHDRIPPNHPVVKGLRKAQALSGVSARGKKNPDVIAAAEFSARCAESMDVLREQPPRRFWRAATGFARDAMRARLEARNQLTYDELLDKVGAALARETEAGGARPLADALCAAWPVALVDEFQDTDGQQYGILDAIYRDAAGARRGRLVMIGDPKQAIYRFRGGDIHAYRRAADEVDADGRMRLDRNHRSSPALVEAFNQFYACGGAALCADGDGGGIAYRPMRASHRRDDEPYTIAGEPCARPLAVHYLAAAAATSAARQDAALCVCANQIAALLEAGTHRIGDRRVQPADIAVLLPSGRAIGALRDLLVERRVPCVTSTRSSVFETDVARELQVVLHAVLHDEDLPALRGAATTRLWGDGLQALRQRMDDVAGWQPVADVFRQWHGLWRERGVAAVVGALAAHLAARYLHTLGGERVLTDLRHLGELLQARSERSIGDEELLAWLATCRADAAAAGTEVAEAAQLRIESDRARVRLMTLHASKGLEFPIVFLPLMWAHGEHGDGGLHVTTGADGRRTVGFSAEAKAAALRDLQDERFRVLYVALTRAIYACHVFALQLDRKADGRARTPAQGTARSALDVMLARMEPPLLAGTAVPSPELAAKTPAIGWIEGWEPASDGSFTPPAPAAATRTARPLPPFHELPLAARHSFTTLVAGASPGVVDTGASAADEADADPAARMEAGAAVDGVAVAPATATAPEPHPGLAALAAVRGTDIGNAIHAVFELRQVGVPLAAQHELVASRLDDAGVRRQGIAQAELVKLWAQRLQGALDAPLGLDGSPALCLADLAAVDQRAEMAFYFTLDHVPMAALRQACARHGEADLVPASGHVLSGLMNGKIDLLFQHDGCFHVLDYKGNHLGDAVADYQGDVLRAHMDEHDYRFQALLYTVAVDRYLRQRLGSQYRRARQLGECVYLFVRAAGLAPGAGIWRHRFADGLLDAVGAVLDGAMAGEDGA